MYEYGTIQYYSQNYHMQSMPFHHFLAACHSNKVLFQVMMMVSLERFASYSLLDRHMVVNTTSPEV